jgi:lysophospholipase L1-like esterase
MRGEAAVCDGTPEGIRRTIAINTLGQRDRSRTYSRTAGVPRVLVLGDSFVEAMQVDLEDTFTARLERRLGVEVLNAGVSGYSTDNELRAFVRSGRRYRPDLVLLVFHVGNDVFENGARLYLKTPRGLPPKPWLRSFGAPLPLATCLALERSTAHLASATPALLWHGSHLVRATIGTGAPQLLARACASATGPDLGAGLPEFLGVYQSPATPAWREAWATTEGLLRRLDRRVRAAGARFSVAVGPACFEYDPGARSYEVHHPAARARAWEFDYPYRRLAPLLSAEHIPWMSLRPALEAHAAATGRSGCYRWDGHWTPEGHAVVARALAPFVTGLTGTAEGTLPARGDSL